MQERAQWQPQYSVGNETLDSQHKKILAQCDALADCISDQTHDAERRFQEILSELVALVREHFSTEEGLLVRYACPALEEYRNEREEFEYLLGDIATTENFDRAEIQRFMKLWVIGHVVGSGSYRAFVDGSRGDAKVTSDSSCAAGTISTP